MCIGIPMRVIEAWPEGALAVGRNGAERIDTRLVGGCAADDWLLVFQGAARERLDPLRAAEIEAALDLLQAGLAGDLDAAGAAPGFQLPSAMTAAQLAALTAPAGVPASPTERDPS
jgi:hydrogenase expression/formation protein HypC